MGVQGLSAKGLERLAGWFYEAHDLGLKARSIGIIPEQRMTQMGQMDPDLMGPASLQPAGQEGHDRLAGGAGVFLQKFPMGHGLAAVRADRLLVARMGMAPERRIDRAFRAVRRAPH